VLVDLVVVLDVMLILLETQLQTLHHFLVNLVMLEVMR
jgi:hypothetical protein